MRAIPRLVKWIFFLALFLFVLLTSLRLFTFIFFRTEDMSLSGALSAFVLGIRYDARFIAIPSVTILLVGSIPALHPFSSRKAGRGWLYYMGLIGFLIILFYVSDFIYFRYLAQRLNASSLSFLDDAKISAGMLWQTYPVIKILLAMIIAVFLFVWAARSLYLSVQRHPSTSGKLSRRIWFAICFLVSVLAIFGRVGQYPLRWSDAFNTGSDFYANIALNPFQSFFSSLVFRGARYDSKKLAEYYPLMVDYLGVQQPDPESLHFRRVLDAKKDSASSPPNIILVICESFSAYKSSMWGNPLNTTPFFNELCKEGLFFDNCFTPHYGTARGVWATITGIPDVDIVKTASRNPAMVDQHTIINDFTGYEKFYFLGGSTSWANIRGLLTNNIGGLHLYEEDSYDVPKIDVWGISDKNLFLQADKILSGQKTPFIAIIQTADNHRPYTIPEEDLDEFKKVSLPPDSIEQNGFSSLEELNAFRYTDFCYRKFIEAARKSPYFSNTIFAFVGDHGIPGNAGALFPAAWTLNGLTKFHVPLLFYSPALIRPDRIHDVASQVDMLPTLAGLANIPYTNTTLGRDLLHPAKQENDNTAFIMDHDSKQIGVVRGDYFYLRQPDGRSEDFVWANFTKKEPPGHAPDSLKAQYRSLTTAFFETARFMLLNNKKAGFIKAR